ncbi:hypothetical protein AHAS_Ahas09G0212300 [Arachis hypogaea]
MAYKVVGMVDMSWDHMEVFGGIRLVSMVVESYIKEEIHRHMVVVVDNHKEVHHIHWIDMHLGLNYAHIMPEEVVAMKIVHILETLPPLIFPSLIHILIEIFTSYNIVRTKLIVKRVRIHGNKRK